MEPATEARRISARRSHLRVENRDFARFSRRFRVVRFSCRLCENTGAKLANPIFAEFWPVLSDQKPANRKNSL